MNAARFWNPLALAMGSSQELDHSVTVEDFFGVMYHNWGRMITVMREHSLKYKQIKSYLERCNNYQCIGEDEALEIWSDYLRMADRLGYDLSDRSKLYPTSLKKEHDIAAFSYKAIEDQIKAEEFRKRAEQTARLEYLGKKYIVKAPTMVEDISREGSALHHCVKSYIGRISDGETEVVFVRKKDDPDTPFFTVEVRDNAVVQCKGNCNSAPSPEVKDFVREWCAKKDLKLVHCA